jgi:ABC-2 type transport system permease protein
MGNKLLILTKVLLKNGFGIKADGKKKVRQIVFLVLLALCFLPVISSLVVLISALYDVLKVVGQEGMILSLGIGITSFVIFFFGVFYIINVFYYSNDVENLLPLPLKPSEIIGAKFFVTVIYEYFTEIIILLPLLIVYGIKSGAPVMYYLYALIVFLLVPFIPLVIASILVMIIMRFTGIAKNKDRFKMIGGLVAVGGALGFNAVIQRFASDSVDPQKIQEMFTQGNNSLIGLTAGMFPSTRFAALSIVNNLNIYGITNLLIFVLLTMACFILFLYIGELLYFRGVIGISETATKRKKVSSEDIGKLSIRKSKLIAYTQKELKLIFRTPVYFMNCILINFVWPVVMLIPFFTESKDAGDTESLITLFESGNYSGIIVAAGFAAVMFISASNAVAASSISREGQSLYVSKYLPASYRVQIMAKVLSGISISLIGLMFMIIPAGVLLHIPFFLILLIILTGLLGIAFTSFTGVIIDLFNPKLHWDNEQKAVKQNLNVLFNMLLSAVFAGITVGVAVVFEFGLFTVCSGIFVVFVVLNILMYRFVSTRGVKLLSDMEV